MLFVVPLLLQLFLLLIRPHEMVPAIDSLSPLHLSLALSAAMLLADYQLGHSVRSRVPLLRTGVAFWLWAFVTLLIARPGSFVAIAVPLTNTMMLFLLISHGIQTVRALERVASFLLAMMLFLALLGVHQAQAPHGCFVYDEELAHPMMTYEGHECETVADCRKRGDPELQYACEHIGLLGTSSVHDRVRYRGMLEDPNELSLAISVSLPFAFALFQRKKSLIRGLLLALSIFSMGLCTVYSQSRGGQVVFLVVMVTYGLRVFGLRRGIAFSLLLAAPMLLLGGRSDGESSSLERLGCWREGIEMLRAYPAFGVGMTLFGEHHFLTAHNSYVLVAAELGILGYLLFSVLIYLSIKVPAQALRALSGMDTPEAEALRTWSIALLASLSGSAAGIFFLSLAYHPIVWIYLGLSGALATMVRRHLPDFDPRVSTREVLAIFVVDVVVIVVVYLYAVKYGD